MSGSSVKLHNGELALGAKIAMREQVLAAVPGPRVFDAFCGPAGEMYCHVWHKADSYVGVDEVYTIGDKRRRFLADNRIVLRTLDLGAFNIFDLDAFGMPWEQLAIIGARRTWADGEVGAIVVTDGSSVATKRGSVSNAMLSMLGLPRGTRLPVGQTHASRLHKSLLSQWLRQNKLSPLRVWRAEGRSNAQQGGIVMLYNAVVFSRQPADVA